MKVLILTLVMAVWFSIGAAAFSPEVSTDATAEPSEAVSDESSVAMIALVIVCLIDTIVLTYFILRSRLTGLRLMAVVAVVYYGVKTFLPQIEAWYFMSNLTPEMIPDLFLMTVPVALLFPPVAVLVLGKMRGSDELAEPNTRLMMPAGQLIWKVALLAMVVYPALYFVFGYYVAWRNPAVQAFYGGTDPGSFVAQMQNTIQGDPTLYAFQIVRGLVWIALAAIVIRTTKGRAWEAGLLVALLFAVVPTNALLFPNPLMPADVRAVHLVETVPSNFIWACVVAWLLHRRHCSLRDLFSLCPQERIATAASA